MSDKKVYLCRVEDRQRQHAFKSSTMVLARALLELIPESCTNYLLRLEAPRYDTWCKIQVLENFKCLIRKKGA